MNAPVLEAQLPYIPLPGEVEPGLLGSGFDCSYYYNQPVAFGCLRPSSSPILIFSPKKSFLLRLLSKVLAGHLSRLQTKGKGISFYSVKLYIL